jgi:hypothetical protein
MQRHRGWYGVIGRLTLGLIGQTDVVLWWHRTKDQIHARARRLCDCMQMLVCLCFLSVGSCRCRYTLFAFFQNITYNNFHMVGVQQVGAKLLLTRTQPMQTYTRICQAIYITMEYQQAPPTNASATPVFANITLTNIFAEDVTV